MDGIRMIGMSVCVTAAVTALFSMLVPDGKMDKVLKFGISLFFLTGLISPFVSGKLDFHVDVDLPTGTATQQNMSRAVESQFTGMAERNLSAAIERLLLREGFNVKKVELRIHIDEQGGVFMEQMQITVPKAESAEVEKIQAVVQREIGFTPEVRTGD